MTEGRSSWLAPPSRTTFSTSGSGSASRRRARRTDSVQSCQRAGSDCKYWWNKTRPSSGPDSRLTYLCVMKKAARYAASSVRVSGRLGPSLTRRWCQVGSPRRPAVRAPVALAGTVVVAAENLAGRQVGTRLERQTLQFFDLGTRELASTRPHPIPARQGPVPARRAPRRAADVALDRFRKANEVGS